MADEITNGQDHEIESKVMRKIAELGSCTFSRLTEALPEYSWNQTFLVVDQLSRDGSLTLLRHPHLLEYLVELKMQKAS